MRFTNHIALRFLTDDTLAFEIIETTHFKEVKKILNRDYIGRAISTKVKALWQLVNKDNQKAYLVTDTVHDKLDMLKVKRDSLEHYDWTVFNRIPDCKKTFILQPTKDYGGGGCLRILVNGDVIEFCHLCFRFSDNSKEEGTAMWTMFYINTVDNHHAEHCAHQNVQDIYEFIYKLMCFVFLSENEYEVIQPGRSNNATKKNGKVLNDLPVPLTIINSRWNITTIRSEGFMVRGHFALRRCGVGRTETRMVYIEPFEKHGLIRKAKNSVIN